MPKISRAASASAAPQVSVDWKRNSITNNSYSRSVLCGAGHSRALACRGRAGGRQRAVSKRVKSKLGGAVRMASARRPRRSPCLSATLEHHAAAFPPESLATSLAATSRWAMCMGIFPPASKPGSVGFRSDARPAVLGGRPGGPGTGERAGAGLAAAALVPRGAR